MSYYDETILDTGAGKIELRRHDGFYEFRPKLARNPTNLAEVHANLEVGLQGGAWVPVPDHLLGQAKAAFQRTVAARGEE